MPRLSIITAAWSPGARYLAQTAESVRRQVLPRGWRLEWLVQEDGPRPDLLPRLAGLPRVRYEANGASLGLAATRNLALSRATGDLVQVLDHDDLLLPGALARVAGAFRGPGIHWAVGQADDLLADGSRRPYPSPLPYGLVPPGQVNAWSAAHGGRWPVHCAGLMMRTASLRAVGGWAGTPADDDIAMFAALSELGAGVNVAAVTWLYRLHPDQTHRSAGWQSRVPAARRIAAQRAAAIREAGLTLATDPRSPDLTGTPAL